MAKFFIDRPIFAWVIALFVIVLGAVSITPVADRAQYPSVASDHRRLRNLSPARRRKPSNSVLAVIEREMNSTPGLATWNRSARPMAPAPSTLSFSPVPIRISRRSTCRRTGCRASPACRRSWCSRVCASKVQPTTSSRSRSCRPDDPAIDVTQLGDYASRNVLPEIQRVPGVGQATLVRHRARDARMDRPAKLTGFNLTADVNAAIAAQKCLDRRWQPR